MSAYNQNRRIGSFVAVNSGRIEGCVADIHANFGSESAGFVYENSGEVDSSLTVRVGSKKTNRKIADMLPESVPFRPKGTAPKYTNSETRINTYPPIHPTRRF